MRARPQGGPNLGRQLARFWAALAILFAAAPLGGASQWARPDGDIVSLCTWGGSVVTVPPFWLHLDEVVADDADYVVSSPASTSTCYIQVSLTDIPDPVSSTGHIIRVRANLDTSSFGAAYLYQGATLKANPGWTFTGTPATYTYTLTGAEADSITDYTNLSLIVQKDTSNNRLWIYWAEFETPQPARRVIVTSTGN